MKLKEKICNVMKDDNGEIMLEFTIIFIMVLFLLIGMISLGFLFYQQSVVNSITTEIAENIGANFRVMGNSHNEDETKYNFYRNTFFLNEKNKLREETAKKTFNVNVKTLGLGIVETNPTVDITTTCDNIGRIHINVTTSVKCKFLFQEALIYLGVIDSSPTISSSAEAECLDMSSYSSQIFFANYCGDKLTDISSAAAIIDDVISLINSVSRIYESQQDDDSDQSKNGG